MRSKLGKARVIHDGREVTYMQHIFESVLCMVILQLNIYYQQHNIYGVLTCAVYGKPPNTTSNTSNTTCIWKCVVSSTHSTLT